MSARTSELEDYLERHPDTAHIDAFIIDLCGNAIGKRLPLSQAEGLFSTGTPTCVESVARSKKNRSRSNRPSRNSKTENAGRSALFPVGSCLKRILDGPADDVWAKFRVLVLDRESP